MNTRGKMIAGITIAATVWAAAARADDGVVKVFILAGQSNMVGHGKVEMGRDPNYKEGEPGAKREIKGGLGCLRRLATDPATAAKYKGLLGADGNWVQRDDCWIYTTTSGKKTGKLSVGYGAGIWFGPELGFGWVVADHLSDPVLIIKTAWGGKSLAVDFRPPSSGKSPFKGKPEDTGKYYRDMIRIVKDVCINLGTYFPALAGRRVELAGFGWHQGWNDACNRDMVAEYEVNMGNFIRDVRKDLGAANLPFVIADSGMTGEGTKGIRADLCAIQMGFGDPKKHPEFAGTVAAVETRGFARPVDQSPSNFGYHWNHNAQSHYLVGEAMGQAMVKLLKGRK